MGPVGFGVLVMEQEGVWDSYPYGLIRSIYSVLAPANWRVWCDGWGCGRHVACRASCARLAWCLYTIPT